MTTFCPLLLFFAAAALSAPTRAQAPGEPEIVVPIAIGTTGGLGVGLSGLRPGTRVRLHALRRATVTPEGQPARAVVVHAWADFRADAQGNLLIDRAVPLAGTWRGKDPLGPLWSGWPLGDARLTVLSDGLGAETLTDNRTLLLTLELDGKRQPTRRIAITPPGADLIFTELTVARDGVSGVLAVPRSMVDVPAIIQLHGSEGGGMAAARARTLALADAGYAVLALNYVAYAYGTPPIAGVPTTFTNLPVELLDRARQALANRPGIDARRVALVGASKGAELALVGAATYPWVKATVACVPSDIVWAGFGRAPAPGERLSSWSVKAQPLLFVAYDRYDDVFAGKASAAEVHRRSRALAAPAEVKAARIPVERIRTPVLLLGSGKDEVWPSAEMGTAVAATLRRTRGPKAVELATYPEAGHGICGTGSAPVRAAGQNPAATTQAAGDAFRRTLDFLHRTLR